MTDTQDRPSRTTQAAGFVRSLTRLTVEEARSGLETRDRVDWMRVIPFIGIHVACIAVIWVGWSWTAVGVAALMYALRMFAITGFYHRYFSHRTFKTSRFGQFMLAVAGASCVQRGPLWWAAHHRKHHRYSDQPADVHSPIQHGVAWAHCGWFTTRPNYATDVSQVKDLAKFPELCFLDRHDALVPALLALSMLGLGALLEAVAPQLGTGPWQMLIWGFFISTVVLYHAVYTINSFAHLVGSRRFETKDDSRNNLLLALLTFGEGWHNNHHRYPGSVRQGFYWWEIDLTYYGLWVMSKLGLIWDLHPVPAKLLEDGRRH